MKRMIPIVSLCMFILGIGMIVTSDSGIIANYNSANLAGAIICLFSGTWLAISIYYFYKNEGQDGEIV